MPKVKFLAERSQTFSSSPPGVLITCKPGEVYELDGGFEYLKGNPAFKVLAETKVAEAPKPGDEKKGDAADEKKADEKKADEKK